MKGLMWKRGYTFPTMKRVFCVLEGSMLSVYGSEHEFDRGHAPHKVVEITQVQLWDGRSTFKHYDHGFILIALGGKSYQCSVDSALLQKEWIHAIQSSLEEPYRIVADEIIDAQRDLNSEVKEERDTASVAAEAVQRAEVASRAIRSGEEHVKLLREKQAALDQKLHDTTDEMRDAERKANVTLEKSKAAKQAAHDDILRNAAQASQVSETLKKDAATLSALYEVEMNVVTTLQKSIHDIKEELAEIQASIAAAVADVTTIKQNAEQTIQQAAGAIHSAQTAKVKVKLRLASWTSSHSHVDSLAQGYLKVKNTLRPKMHRKYFVLFGKTLCWYKNADDYFQNIRSPLGVVHVAGPIKDWSGKVGLTTYPNAFAIPTVEGKELHVSASVANEVSTWSVAVLTGATMIPMSPERARDAKTRRDSFDLTSPPAHTHRMSFFASTDGLHDASLSPSSQKDKDAVADKADVVIVEGSLVKQGHFVPTMKRKYCVVVGIHIYFFDSHEQYVATKAESGGAPLSPDTTSVSCSEVVRVTDWDGHLLLMTYPHAFQIDTAHHAHIHCSAASAKEKERWMKGLRTAIGHHAADVRAVGSIDSFHHVADESKVPLTDQARAVLEFETILTDYFHQHNSAKHEDVYVMTKLFQGREGELLKHLDETYSTTLAKDHASLVAKLTKYHAAKLADDSAIETDGLLPHLEGVLQFDVPALLTTTKVKVYAVLLGNKLLHFTTRIAALTEPDHPTETLVFVAAEAAPDQPLKLQVVDPAGTKRTYETSSSVQRDHWIRTMHLGIEYARAHRQRATLKVSESTTLQEILDVPVHDDCSPESAEFKQLVVAYYEEHNPDGLASVEALLMHFRGKEHLLLTSLDKMYGTNLVANDHMAKLCTALSAYSSDAMRTTAVPAGASAWRTSLACDGSVPRHKKTGFIMVKCAPTMPQLKKCYCVVEGATLTCYAGIDLAQVLLGPWRIDNVSVGDGQFSMYVETAAETKVFAQLPTEVEFHGWLSACHVAIATHHVTALNESPLAKYLIGFYAKTNPAKVADVPLLLDSFSGREMDLLVKIDAVYHTTLATDPQVLALVPAASTTAAATVATTDDHVPLMQGYFMKKGYDMPSMAKFYGVLLGHVLHVYDTKEDAVAKTETHPPKELAAVAEWSGSTHEKFRFGLELVTTAHRTYFVAFDTDDAKVHWTSAIQHGLALQRLATRIALGVLQSDTTKAIRDTIVQSYSHVSQHFVDELNGVLELSHGFDMDVLKMLDKKYGTHMSLDPDVTGLLETTQPARGYEAALTLTSSDGQTSQNLFGVLADTKLQCFADREGFKSGLLQPQLAVTCLAVSPWKGQFDGFVVDTAEGKPVYLMGATPAETTRWIDALQTALDKANLSGLLHSVPADGDNVLSSFLSIEANGKLVRRYVVLEDLEIKVYTTPDALQPAVRYDVVAISPWSSPTAPSQSFQLDCRSEWNSALLRCVADSDEIMENWQKHVAAALKRKAGDDLIHDQAIELTDATSSAATFQASSVQGYMMYRTQVKGKWVDAREGFFLLNQDQLIGYSDETSARAGDLAAQVLVVDVQSLFESQSSGGHQNDFYLQGKVGKSSSASTLHFIPPDSNDRTVWVAAINSALNDSRGRTLLHEQEAELALHTAAAAASRTSSNPRLGYVVPNSTMEGSLQRVQEAFLHVARDPSMYYVLVHDTLRWFATKAQVSTSPASYEENSNNSHSDGTADETSMKVLSVSDWDGSPSGFQVDAIFRGVTGSIQFVAASASDKERWIRALKAASDEAVAEQTLRDILNRQTTLQSQPSSEIFQEGFVHLRRSHFAAVWKEHYCVLKGPWLTTYETREDFATAPGKPTSKVEVVFVGDWYGAVSAGGAKNMFRIETIEHGFLEAYVDDPADKPQWMQTLQTAVSSLKADELVARDLSMPSYAGATMEGYLTKHGGTVRGSLKRYCVLLRTVWLYFASQEDALSGTDPLGTLQVIGLESTTSEGIVPEHSFMLLTSGRKDKLCCEAHTGAEKQLWVNAIQGELDQEEALRGDIRAAEARERSKAQQLQDTVNKSRVINEEAAALDAEMEATLKQFEHYNSGGDDDVDDDTDDDDDDATPYVEYVDPPMDNAPENSPVRRASKNKSSPQLAPPPDFGQAGDPSTTPWPWLRWCKCFAPRPPLDSKVSHDPMLTDHERRLYSCEFYSNGTMDSSL